MNDPMTGLPVPQDRSVWFYVVLGRVLEAALKAGCNSESDRVLAEAQRVMNGERPNG